MRDSNGEPWFVARKDMAANSLWIVQGHDHPWLLSRGVVAEMASWTGPVPRVGERFGAKTRYRQADAACEVAAVDGKTFTLRFDTPQWAATPGQSAVLYDGEVCLGGGIIASTREALATPVEAGT
jgi:tRNA-specific 2-thiouridylase